MRLPTSTPSCAARPTRRAPAAARTLAAAAACALAAATAGAQALPTAGPQALLAPAQPAATQSAARLASAPQAASVRTAPSQASPEDAIRFMAERAVGPDHRVEIQFGQLDPRLQLAPCGRVEPFVPAAARLWGRTSIGLRCIEGANWSVLMPMTVRVFGVALVAAAPLAVGAAPSAADFRLEEIELTREPVPVVRDAAELEGKTLIRPLSAGQPLRQDALRTPPSVTSGDPVKIVVIGQGFTISGEGVSMSTAAEGQRVRVRTESGRVVSGELRGRTVELRL